MSERIGCKHCNYKGYVKHSFYGGGEDGDEGTVTVSICSHCEDSRGYHAYVKNKYGTQKDNVVQLVEEEPTATVLDFNEFKKRKKSGE